MDLLICINSFLSLAEEKKIFDNVCSKKYQATSFITFILNQRKTNKSKIDMKTLFFLMKLYV
jgi:hypothetical protein